MRKESICLGPVGRRVYFYYALLNWNLHAHAADARAEAIQNCRRIPILGLVTQPGRSREMIGYFGFFSSEVFSGGAVLFSWFRTAEVKSLSPFV